MTRLEAAEMRFVRSVTGYTRLDKITSEVIKKELEISGMQDVRLRYKQNWINRLGTTSDSRNTPSTTNLEDEEIVDVPGNDGNASMPEQVKRPNPRRKMMMMMMTIYIYLTAVGLTPGGGSTVHIYTQTVHRTVQYTFTHTHTHTHTVHRTVQYTFTHTQYTEQHN
jgi:hypothetical protein